MTFASETDRRWIIKKETLLRFVLTLMLSVGSVSFVEPSPYELLFFILFPVAVLGHFVITRVTLTLFFIIATFLIAETASLVPYFEHRPMGLDNDNTGTPALYTFQTIYLFGSAVLFAMIFTRHTPERTTLALRAFAFSSVVAAVWAILAYLHVQGFMVSERDVGRVSGPFKDPNVLGSYCVLGALYLMQRFIIGSPRARLFHLAGLAITLFGGVFLPLSRGAWGAMAFSAIFLIVATYVTADDGAMRRKIAMSIFGIVILVAGAGVYIASNSDLRDSVSDRAKLEQDYDGGETGRFGNQKRSIPMLIERPLGFGPHRFMVFFDLDPHNSYIGAFSSAGWLGGLTFLLMVAFTSVIGLRLVFRRSPYLRQAQVMVPALLSAFLQAFQIDIDHWRFVFLMIGAVWGMEAARVQAVALARKLSSERPASVPVPRPRSDAGPRTVGYPFGPRPRPDGAPGLS